MITTPLTAALVHGAAELEQTDHGLIVHRLPAWARRQCPDPGLMDAQAKPSGVRVGFSTTSAIIQLITHPLPTEYVQARRPRGRIDVFVDGELRLSDELTGGDETRIDLVDGTMSSRSGPHHVTTIADLDGGEHLIELWLPHNESLRLIEMRSDAPLRPVVDVRPRWIHYGSSISQGSNATAPSDIWPAIAARQANVSLRNLGLGGNALVDPFVARFIRDTPADFISLAIGINVANLDGMHMRVFSPAVHGFLDTIRDGHPDTPLLLISPLYCGIHENTPGPGAFDPATFGTDQIRFIATGDPKDATRGRPTLVTMRAAMQEIVAARDSDPALHYLDGLQLFGAGDAEAFPLPDALHPDPEAHRIIGQRFGELAFGERGAFAT
ncbi:SGNH/GDSL hydrolase family protein [Rarobacter faecitabidus]|uniref:GDSL-like lipase/acylhydrolase family protein n=1 Tax=Rarobacter faecitabidus TaxID=13243 RepID=A0A542ZVH5_RARFA|nr:SGNH/GDSL hydrolase family protein [Rarobacter faecitabidus]TQL64364.1 GDSL-like lipase/acylhydrolase family protein [Rarobacter faecitabidus]